MGLLLAAACSRQEPAPAPGSGEPRVRAILLLARANSTLLKANNPATVAVGAPLALRVAAVWAIPSVDDVTAAAAFTVEPAGAGDLEGGGVFRARQPGTVRIRAEARVARGPGGDEPLAPGAPVPGGLAVMTFTDTITLAILDTAEAETSSAKSIAPEPDEAVVLAPTGPTAPRPPTPADGLLQLGNAQLHPLAYLIAQRQFSRGQTVLAAGTRPADDQPPPACQVFGRRLAATDWLLQQDDAALWVHGVPAPPPGLPVVVAGTLAEEDSEGGMKGFLRCRDGGVLKRTPQHTLPRGEFLFFALPGARSVNCPVELTGESLRVVYLDEKSCVVFEGVRPGRTTVRVFDEFRLNDERTLLAQFEVVVPE